MSNVLSGLAWTNIAGWQRSDTNMELGDPLQDVEH